MFKKILSLFKKENKKVVLKEKLVRILYPIIDEYATWNCEESKYLPKRFASDPTGWAEEVNKMQRAFRLLDDELDETGKLWEVKNAWKKYGQEDTEQLKELNKQVQDGLDAFARSLVDLVDEDYKVDE